MDAANNQLTINRVMILKKLKYWKIKQFSY